VIRLAIRASTESADEVLAALLELAPGGVEQVDGDGFVEYAVYGAPGELPSLHVGDATVAGIPVVVSGSEVPDDWGERWKDFHHPVLIGDRVHVRAPWQEPRPDAIEVVIDPGQAFGTGTHPTTRLSLELMLDIEPEGSLADLGCGSGVLAIAACKLGFGPVSAFDYDRAAIEASEANARVNGVELERIERLDLCSEATPAADVVVANLLRPLLLRMASLMERRPRALVLSGLLDHEADEVAHAFAALAEADRRSLSGWTALLLKPA
jgi:ribosomal protein L11 methyltransferase